MRRSIAIRQIISTQISQHTVIANRDYREKTNHTEIASEREGVNELDLPSIIHVGSFQKRTWKLSRCKT